MEDEIEEGAVHLEATVVFQEAELPELIHEEIDRDRVAPIISASMS